MPIAPRGAVGGKRYELVITDMRDRHDHVLAGDEVFVAHLEAAVEDLGPPRCAELVANRDQLRLDDRMDAQARGQDVEIIADFRTDLVELVADLVASKRGEARKPQFEDGACLPTLGRAAVRAR